MGPGGAVWGGVGRGGASSTMRGRLLLCFGVLVGGWKLYRQRTRAAAGAATPTAFSAVDSRGVALSGRAPRASRAPRRQRASFLFTAWPTSID